jgi:hypothetical protein
LGDPGMSTMGTQGDRGGQKAAFGGPRGGPGLGHRGAKGGWESRGPKWRLGVGLPLLGAQGLCTDGCQE